MTDAQEQTTGLDAVYVDLALFERGIQAISQLMRAEALRLLVGGSVRRFQFELREDSSDEVLAEHRVSMLEFRRVLVDLEDVLVATTAGADRDQFVQRRVDSNRFQDGEAEAPSAARTKYDLVSTSFDLDVLRRRVWLKSSAKTNVSGRFDWDVAIKFADSEVDPPDSGRMVTATLRVGSEPPDLEFPLVLTHQDVLMTVDAEDVDYMIDSLHRLKKALGQADTKVGI